MFFSKKPQHIVVAGMGPGGMVDVSGLANGVYIANKQKLTICR